MHNDLSELRPGDCARIIRLHGSLAPRLRDVGFTEGANVRCEGAAGRGSIAAYRVRGCVLALRRRDARCVSVAGGAAI